MIRINSITGENNMVLLKKEEVEKAFYMVDGRYHTNVLSIIKCNEDEKPVYETVMGMLEEDEIRFVYSDETPGAFGAFVLYRNNGRLMMEYVTKENGMYVFKTETCFWVYPGYKDFDLREKVAFAMKLKEYAQYESLNIQVGQINNQNPEDILKQTERDTRVLNTKQVQRVIILAHFWRVGFLVLLLVLAIAGKYLFPDNKYGILIGLSAGIMFYGFYLLIGILFRFRHIYCMYQLANHQKMTPNAIYWNSMKKSSLYGVPIVCFIFGMAGAIIFILEMYGIIG